MHEILPYTLIETFQVFAKKKCEIYCWYVSKKIVNIVVQPQESRHVTRIDVFWYLVQLLPQTSRASEMDNYEKTKTVLPAPMVMT